MLSTKFSKINVGTIMQITAKFTICLEETIKERKAQSNIIKAIKHAESCEFVSFTS